VQQPRDSKLRHARPILLAERIENGCDVRRRSALLRHRSGIPGGEGDAVGLGGSQQGGAGAIAHVVMRCHGGDFRDALRSAELLDADVGQADMADDALVT